MSYDFTSGSTDGLTNGTLLAHSSDTTNAGYNVAIGYQALMEETGVNQSVAIGSYAASKYGKAFGCFIGNQVLYNVANEILVSVFFSIIFFRFSIVKWNVVD